MMDIVEEFSFEPESLPISESTDSVVTTSDQDVPDLDNDVPDAEGINHLSYDGIDGSVTPDVAALYRAVNNLDVNAVETIVKSGVDVNCADAKLRYSSAQVLLIQLENEILIYWNLLYVTFVTVVFLSQTFQNIRRCIILSQMEIR